MRSLRRGSAVATPAAARKSEAVDISSTDYTAVSPCDAIYIGSGGNLVCRLVGDGADRTFSNLIGGCIYPLAVSIVRRASTTTTGMILLRER